MESELSDVGIQQRFVDVGLTDIIAGVYKDFTNVNIDANLRDIMFASFSLAGFFPPAESMGTSWFSGSTVWNLDIFSVVNKCLETVASKDIVVDVILTSEKTLKQVDASNFNTIQVL